MKSSLGKLRRFALHKNDAKEKIDFRPSAQLDELSQAAQDMQDMRDCYDSLLSAAAATANSAYEFSESLQEMGSCLLEKTVLHDDEESNRVLLSLGKVQLELQKLVDSYRSHIFLTITNPSESLLNELRTVEEMKRQCDEKRNVYEYMMAQQREKGRSKSGKGEVVTSQQLQTAQDEFEEEATLCVFRLKSLKQGQSRSLLTQAARHHAAQLNFFRKGVKSLEAVEPHLRLVTEMQHIDYQFSGLEDDDGEDDGSRYDPNEDGEKSFEYRPSKQGPDAVTTSRNSMEVDQVRVSFPQASAVENAELNPEKHHVDLQVNREFRVGSHSAPLFADKKSDPVEKVRQIQPSSTQKLNTYVLPTPVDAKGFIPSRKSSSDLRTMPSDISGRTHNLWHSSPLEEKKLDKHSGAGLVSGRTLLRTQSVLKESNSYSASTQLPPPLVEGRSFLQLDTFNVSDTKKFKRQAFSGPLTSKPLSTNPVLSTSGLVSSTEGSQQDFGALSGVRIPRHSSSPKVSPSASPPLVSSPRISELHELPRPPGIPSKPAKSPGLTGHSAPLGFRNQEISSTKKPSVMSNATPLPTPPLIIPRSFSIPSNSQRATSLHVAKHLESHQVPENTEEFTSPPLTPLSLASTKAIATVSEGASQPGKIKGGS